MVNAVVDVADPATVAPSTGVPAGLISTRTPTYTWTALAGAAWYQLQVTDSTATMRESWFTPTEACVATSCSVTPNVVLSRLERDGCRPMDGAQGLRSGGGGPRQGCLDLAGGLRTDDDAHVYMEWRARYELLLAARRRSRQRICRSLVSPVRRGLPDGNRNVRGVAQRDPEGRVGHVAGAHLE
jgi:hypothetical protein